MAPHHFSLSHLTPPSPCLGNHQTQSFDLGSVGLILDHRIFVLQPCKWGEECIAGEKPLLTSELRFETTEIHFFLCWNLIGKDRMSNILLWKYSVLLESQLVKENDIAARKKFLA